MAKVTANTTTFRPLRPEPFDRDKKFVARRKIILNGKEFNFGEEINKDFMTTRRLRQLYEQRFITMEDYPEEDGTLVKPVFEQLPTQSIRDWLSTEKVLPRPNSKRDGLIRLANITWDKRYGVSSTESGTK